MDLRKSLLLYAVTDRRWLKSGETLFDAVKEAVAGGATMVQLREKELSPEETVKEALEMRDFLEKNGVLLIVDNDIEVTKKSGADGVHLGQDDTPVDEARKILGNDVIIGATAHNVAEAVKAEKDGADYLGVGAAFGSATKKDAKSIVSLDEYRRITDAVSIPVVAIGGIEEYNIEKLKGLGLDGAAVVSAIFAGEDVRAAAGRMRELCEKTFL
ncbi:MAG: thiamine phosphate synthase [Lachnospiraceae bacterium]|uniref:Thiamine-phosphate synthase n=1 Tax=Candidatus Weimeria bifida TaxID=2599074 RepID=A0A6N7J0I9_9FIRM|nr:thiamine phosphate synthase [Candidatus Weimeria bifida]RRF95024.1 MAG: thiamine phosphate synthase [Lachnospiraceae bacterium]